MFAWLRSWLSRPAAPTASGAADVDMPPPPRAAPAPAPEAQASEPTAELTALLAKASRALAAGRADEAQRHFTAVLQHDAGHAQAHFHLGNLLLAQGRLDAAEMHLRRACAAQPGHAQALCNLGALLKDRGRGDEAMALLEQALAQQPTLAPALFNLALLRIGQRRWADAVTLLRHYMTAAPRDAEGPYWLGNALMGDGDAVAARQAYARALKLDDKLVQARWGLGMAQWPAVAQSGAEQAAAPAAFERELTQMQAWFAKHPKVDAVPAVGAQQPYYAAYVAQNHRDRLGTYGALATSLMAGWARKVGAPAPARARGSRCRVGIVSAHLHSHSVWHALLRGWVEHLDPTQFELQLFHTGSERDAETEWAARRVVRLHHGLGPWTAWAKAVSDARIDVLVYPEIGMDSTTLRLAALRLAPVQLASWGHPVTTGLPTIDGFVSAEAFEPPGAQAHYTETLIELPRLGCCYRPFGTRAVQPDLSPWGVSAADRLLLCAGTAFKYAPRDDALLVDVARRCRPCKLLFFRPATQHLAALLEQRLRAAFGAAGVDFDASVCFVPWQSQAAFFGLLDRADVYLDTVGFSGFNSAMQALERGVPVVAWEGEFMRGRFASGLLRQAGLSDWVAHTPEDYAAAVELLCADRGLRDRLRGHITTRRHGLYEDRAAVAAFAQRLLA